MPKHKGKKGGNKGPKGDGYVPEYAADDEALYGAGDEPDPESREYMYDDIDEFHAARDKVLVDRGYQEENYEQSDEEEVLALDSEESDDEEIRNLKAQLRRVKSQQRKEDYGSDIEDKEEEEEDEEEAGLPDSKRWGKKRGKYYGDDDIGLKNIEDEQAEAVLEEREAIRLQKKMAAEMDDQDFGLDLFQAPRTAKDDDTEDKEEKIVKDLSKMSKREKLQLLKKESPELLTLIEDFKEKLQEVQETLQPIREVLLQKNVSGKAADYVHTKFHLNLNYCTNILFYLTLKAKQIPVHNHPVIKRLLQYRNLLTQLKPLDTEMSAELASIVARVKAGEDVILGDTSAKMVRRKRDMMKKKMQKQKKSLKELVSDSEDSDMYEDHATLKQQKKKLKEEGRYETKDEQAALEYYNMMKDGRPQDEMEEEEEGERMEGADQLETYDDDEEMDGKRAISYMIEKNKGLTAPKKKELRNPRVKHRMKFRKAKIRRKGQVREPRKELHKYGGEISGIRAGIKRSVKLK